MGLGGGLSQEWASNAGMSVEELEREVVEGKRAVQHLVRSNIRLVLSIAKKYRSEFVDYSDLIQVRPGRNCRSYRTLLSRRKGQGKRRLPLSSGYGLSIL